MPPEVKSRRFPLPWAVDETEACCIVRNANGQALTYVYFEDEPAGARRRSSSRAMKRGAHRRQHRQAACPSWVRDLRLISSVSRVTIVSRW